jgi:hypothetical protein
MDALLNYTSAEQNVRFNNSTQWRYFDSVKAIFIRNFVIGGPLLSHLLSDEDFRERTRYEEARVTRLIDLYRLGLLTQIKRNSECSEDCLKKQTGFNNSLEA